MTENLPGTEPGGGDGFWDAMDFAERFGELPADRANQGQVCCRECGEPTGGLPAHLGAHGTPLGDYEKQFPGAPLGPPEETPEAVESSRADRPKRAHSE